MRWVWFLNLVYKAKLISNLILLRPLLFDRQISESDLERLPLCLIYFACFFLWYCGHIFDLFCIEIARCIVEGFVSDTYLHYSWTTWKRNMTEQCNFRYMLVDNEIGFSLIECYQFFCSSEGIWLQMLLRHCWGSLARVFCVENYWNVTRLIWLWSLQFAIFGVVLMPNVLSSCNCYMTRKHVLKWNSLYANYKYFRFMIQMYRTGKKNIYILHF